LAGYGYLNTAPYVLTGMVSLAANGQNGHFQDHIKPSQIETMKGKVIININWSRWVEFADTGSMLPVLNVNTNALEIVPESADQVQVGDIISFNSSDGLIVHRVFQTGEDDSGWYALTKGDNSPVPDPYLVRFENVTGIVVAIFY